MSARRDPSQRRLADKSGFTLLEVLVAFTVMAVLLSVLFRSVVDVRSGAVAFDAHTHQELVAMAVLDDALARRDLKPGHYSGLREGRNWTLIATPVDLTAQLPPSEKSAGPPDPKKDAQPKWTPQRLVVRIETAGRPLEVETIRLVRGN